MRRWLAALAGAALAWSLFVWLAGGVDLRAAGLRLTSSDPFRPAILGGVLLLTYLAVAGLHGAREDVARAGGWMTPVRAALGVTVASTAVAFAFNSQTAGGADAYGYVTHADAWLAGSFTTAVPLAATAPWPRALESFTPLAQHPAADRRGLLPVTSPGLPMMMAAFKRAAGHCAMFWVVPLTGALLVGATFVAGRRAHSDAAGLAAAWLVATSPTVVSMNKSVMSDVPAAAFWAASIACALRAARGSAFCAGLAASAAILVRPNMLPLAVWIGAWLLWREWRTSRSASHALAFAAGAAPGCVVVAALNQALRGSPLASGYGELATLFALDHVRINLVRYAGWIAETQTPVWLAGTVALVIPWRAAWPSPEARRATVLLAGSVAVVGMTYVAYEPFAAWWFLRFFLPAWPAMAIGTSVLVLTPGGLGSRWRTVAAALALFALGLYGAVMAVRLGVFPPGEGERRYATIAEIVARHTEPSSVIITLHHAGATRYYAGRDTIRFDLLDERWLDRAVAWLAEQGRPAYFLLEEADVVEFRRRFRAHNHLAREMSPVVAYKAPQVQGWVYLYDPRRPDAQTLISPARRGSTACPLPAAAPR